MSEFYTYKIKDLLKDLKEIDLETEVRLITYDDMEYELTETYYDKEEEKIFLRGDQRFEEGWWKF